MESDATLSSTAPARATWWWPRSASNPGESPVSEDHVQFVVARVLDVADVLWCHTPNGQLRDPIIAGRLVAAGVKAGVPDCLIFDLRKALELKRERGGRVEPDQKRWLEQLERAGWETAVAHGTQAALEVLETWGIDVGACLERVEALGYRLDGGRMVKVPAKRTRRGSQAG